MVRALHVSVSATVAAVTSATVSGMSESSAALSRQSALEQSWSQDLSAESKGKSPVKRVVSLLTKMKSELEAEAGKESEMYDKMVCWCKTNKKEKTAAVAKAETTIKELESEIEGRSARFGELSTNIEAMKKQIAEDTTALRQATGIREQEAAEFRGEETDLVQAITNLKNAIGILSKHHSSLMQLDASAVSGMQVVLRDVAMKHAMLSAKSPRMKRSSFVSLSSSVREVQGATQMEESLRRLVLGALQGTDSSSDDASLPLKFAEKVLTRLSAAQAGGSSFLQASGSSEKQPLSNSYNTRSDGIYGILNQMLEDFESELSSSQQQELTAAEDHKALAAAKNEQLTVGKAKLDEMETELAKNGKGLSDAKENLDLTRKQRAADVEFLRNLKLTCNDLDSQWEERSKTRSMETKAIAETLAILTEDDNREQLVKSSTPASFVQVGEQVSGSSLRARAAAALRGDAASPTFDASDLLAAWNHRGSAAPATGGPRARLTALASMVQLDSFTKVKAMMDKLVADMKEEQAEEVKFKSYCQKEFRENEKAVHAKTNEKKDLAAKMDQLETLIGKLGGEIKDHEAEIDATQTEVKRASQTREAENAVFQTTVADQRAMQDILKKALARLEDFYKKGAGAKALLQRAEQTPPVQFNAYKANAGSAPVMGLLEQIIGDSSTLEREAMKDESTAQADYEKFVKDSNDMIKQLSEAVTEKTKAIASSKEEQTTTKGSHASAVGELESLAAYEADLHRQCDFVLANFEIRQRARMQEMESVAKAKAILSGSAEEA
eukprot:TRINITY_DN13682_c1_g1_i2.p1 TRINITY_DN13682_c1_g1~~TRINITY_DN13682_c1_g1_i2.p1  ORF type:complete len:804 (-),score=265.21 TRINITY_DN13682_c1_g1_i2:85-2436(-)